MIKLEWGDEEGAVWEKYSTKSDAIDALNSHHEECDLPRFDDISPELQNHFFQVSATWGFKIPPPKKIMMNLFRQT